MQQPCLTLYCRHLCLYVISAAAISFATMGNLEYHFEHAVRQLLSIPSEAASQFALLCSMARYRELPMPTMNAMDDVNSQELHFKDVLGKVGTATMNSAIVRRM
jgi:hypothetical protein